MYCKGLLAVILLIPLFCTPGAQAQQTLGGITGTVFDSTGRALPDVAVKATADDTRLERRTLSNEQGAYSLVDLPIGKYSITFTRAGFSTEHVGGILVQADRTVALPVRLAVGAVTDSMEVDVHPLLNAIDITNGYVLEKSQIEAIPLPTGSFTGLAILSPGVNAELPGGTGVNSGLGNAPIWANGERDTSNSFLVNGVDVSIGAPPALDPACFQVPLVTASSPKFSAVPAGDNFETDFTTGQRNIFRQAAQRRADISVVKVTTLKEHYDLKYTFDVYNFTNTTSFDVPGNEVFQNQFFDQFPSVGQTAAATGCQSDGSQGNSSFYNCPGGLGYVGHAIGSPRQIQMSLQLKF